MRRPAGLALVWLLACGTSTGTAPRDGGGAADAAGDVAAPACGGGGEGCCGAMKTCNAGLACILGLCRLPPVDGGDSGTCPFVRCGGACTNTTSDAKNCGTCGHDCLTTTCSAGLCLDTGVASGVSPVRLAVDSARVYFTDVDGTVNVAPSAGGTVERLVSGVAGPFGVALGPPFVYFTAEGTLSGGFKDGGVYRVPGGGAGDGGAAFPIATGRPKPQALVVDAKNVYWIEPGSTKGGSLLSCPIAGCPANKPNVLVDVLALPYGLTQDATTLYVTTFAGGEVVSFSKATGASKVLASSLNQPTGITAASGKLYWGNVGDGLIQSMDAAGGPITGFATTMGSPRAIAADAIGVYWSDTSPDPVTTLGAVDSCAISGCPPATLETLVNQGQTATDLAIDARYVYWIGSGGGILRVAK